jgi:transcriptional regulator with XRE-family HTH domain
MSDRLAGLVAAFRSFGTAKELARAGGCSVPTAQRYRSGDTSPDVLTLTRLMASSRAIADAVLRLAGLDDVSLDIEQARLLRSLAELHEKRRKTYVVLDQAAQTLAVDTREAGRVARRSPAAQLEPPGPSGAAR